MCCLTNQVLWNYETACCLVNCNAFSFDGPHRFDIALFQIYFTIDQIKQNGMFAGLSYFCRKLRSLARLQVKTLVAKFKLLPRKTSISGISLYPFVN